MLLLFQKLYCHRCMDILNVFVSKIIATLILLIFTYDSHLSIFLLGEI